MTDIISKIKNLTGIANAIGMATMFPAIISAAWMEEEEKIQAKIRDKIIAQFCIGEIKAKRQNKERIRQKIKAMKQTKNVYVWGCDYGADSSQSGISKMP